MKLAFHASPQAPAQKALSAMKDQFGDHDMHEADTLVVLGGDGSMLRALHNSEDINIPLFGMNMGTLGFLLNNFDENDLIKRIENACRFTIHPLRMEATDAEGETHSTLAYNEVSLLRQTHNSAKIKVTVNEKERLDELVCDGIMLSTPMGSTAYNQSAGGPIVPLDANVLPLTPISAFRPRRWRGALLRNDASVQFDILFSKDRPVSASGDSSEVRNVTKVEIRESRSIERTLLFDCDNPLEERIFQEQFAP